MVIKNQKVIAIIQARLTSSRLPAKVMKDLAGKTLLERVIERTRLSSLIDEIWIATSEEKPDDIIRIMGENLGVHVYRGSLEDVLSRFCGVINTTNTDIIVRITADNPLTEPLFIDEGIRALIENDLDYVIYEGVPYGTGIEVVRSKVLLDIQQQPLSQADKEHVTLFIRNNTSMDVKTLVKYPDRSFKRPDIRLTIDTLDDYIRLYKIYNQFKNRIQEKDILTNIIDYVDNTID